MQIADLEHLMEQHPEVDVLAQELSKKGNSHFLLTGLYASARGMILAALHSRLKQQGVAPTMLIVMDNADDAQYMYADIKTLLQAQDVYYFPNSHRRRQGKDEAMAVQRTEVLSALLGDEATRLKGDKARGIIIVTYPEALAESVPQPQSLQGKTITLSVGEEIAISQLTAMLLELDFKRVDFVYEPGQFAVRGGIVDVYSYACDIPMRIDFFGNEIDSIREFELETQLSQNKVDTISIVASSADEQAMTNITAYLPPKTLWISHDFGLASYKIKSAITEFDATLLTQAMEEATTIELNQKSTYPSHNLLAFDTLPQPTFNKNFDLLIDDLQQRTKDGYRIYILADQVKQTDRLKAIFDDKESGIAFVAVDHALHEGFIDH
jgi:transcription-repair coupling factor (superfamily II helicase)